MKKIVIIISLLFSINILAHEKLSYLSNEEFEEKLNILKNSLTIKEKLNAVYNFKFNKEKECKIDKPSDISEFSINYPLFSEYIVAYERFSKSNDKEEALMSLEDLYCASLKIFYDIFNSDGFFWVLKKISLIMNEYLSLKYQNININLEPLQATFDANQFAFENYFDIASSAVSVYLLFTGTGFAFKFINNYFKKWYVKLYLKVNLILLVGKIDLITVSHIFENITFAKNFSKGEIGVDYKLSNFFNDIFTRQFLKASIEDQNLYLCDIMKNLNVSEDHWGYVCL
jgi:hypothetical protein